MDALNLMQVLRRRWLLTPVLLLIVAGAVVALAGQVPAEYQSQGIGLVLRQSEEPVNDTGQRDNPYGAIDDSLSATASLLVTVLTSPAVQEEFAERGVRAQLEVTNEGSAIESQSPFLTVSATASDPQEAARAVGIVLARATRELVDRQDALPGELAETLRMVVVVRPPPGEETRAGLVRAVGLAAAAGVVLALVLIVMMDRLLEARSAKARRRQRNLQSAGTTVPQEAPRAPEGPVPSVPMPVPQARRSPRRRSPARSPGTSSRPEAARAAAGRGR